MSDHRILIWLSATIDFWIMLCATLHILQTRLSWHTCTPKKGLLLPSNNTRPDLLGFLNYKLRVRTQILTRMYETSVTQQLRLVSRSLLCPSWRICKSPASSTHTFSANISLQKIALAPCEPIYAIPCSFVFKSHASQPRLINFLMPRLLLRASVEASRSN